MWEYKLRWPCVCLAGVKACEAERVARWNPELSERLQVLQAEAVRHKEEEEKSNAEVQRVLALLRELRSERLEQDKRIIELERCTTISRITQRDTLQVLPYFWQDVCLDLYSKGKKQRLFYHTSVIIQAFLSLYNYTAEKNPCLFNGITLKSINILRRRVSIFFFNNQKFCWLNCAL